MGSMTHDELLADIDRKILLSEHTIYPVYMQAFRAVVDVLKNYNDGQVRVNEEFNQGILALSNVIKDAIEKELQ